MVSVKERHGKNHVRCRVDLSPGLLWLHIREISIVCFGKGIRNKFHAHDAEQVLIVTEGRGIVATEDKESVVAVGDVVLIPAGEKHWHGATEDTEFSHIYFFKKGCKLTQLEV